MGSLYLEKYGFKEEPFRLTPDPRYFYNGAQYERVLAELRYGIEQKKGFLVLTGEVGTGKTTISRTLLDTLDPKFHTALILNPRLTTEELLRTIVHDFGLRLPSLFPTKKEMVDTLNTFLLKVALEGGGAVLIVDEAQNLTGELLEELRLLSNLETDQEKLLQILLIGQPELSEKMLSRDLRQLRQRISVWATIEPLDRKETGAYVFRRLQVASGGTPRVIFPQEAVKRIHRHGGGYPRTTNILCDRVLMLAFSMDVSKVSARMISRAAREVVRKDERRNHKQRTRLIAATAMAMIVTIIPTGVGHLKSPSSPAETVQVNKPDAQASVGIQDILSLCLTRQGYDHLGKEVRTWHVSGAGLTEIQLALKYFDINRQYNLSTVLVPLDHSLWKKTGTVGIIPWDEQPGFALLEACGEAGSQWCVTTGREEGDGKKVPGTFLQSTREALVLFRPLPGLGAGLEKGSEGPGVYTLQSALIRLGVLSEGEADGIFGSRTANALVGLQRGWGLETAGSLDSQTGYFLSKFAYLDRG